jgi:hypothetical protein
MGWIDWAPLPPDFNGRYLRLIPNPVVPSEFCTPLFRIVLFLASASAEVCPTF